MTIKQHSPFPHFLILALFIFALGTCQSFDKSTQEQAEVPVEKTEPNSKAEVKPSADEEVRIVSAGGTLTEIIFALGQGDKIVGVDTSSVFPEKALALPKVGYQRRLSAEGVLSLNPTLVTVTNHAGPPEVMKQLESVKTNVLTLPGEHGMENAYKRIELLGKALNVAPKATELVNQMKATMDSLSKRIQTSGPKPRVLSIYARGQGSVNVAGKNNASDTIITLAGGVNAINQYEGYRPITAEAVIAANPDFILLPSRGLDSLTGIDGLLKQPGIAQTTAGQKRQVIAIDDLILLGFGPRTPQAVEELAKGMKLLAPEVSEVQ